MKTNKLGLLALLPATALAGTVHLVPETCTRTQICFNVQNDGGLEIDYISDATQYGRLVISISGDIFDSGLYAYPNLASFTIYDPVGNALSGTLSISIVTGSKCVQSGRVCVWPKTVTLKSGTLTLP